MPDKFSLIPKPVTTLKPGQVIKTPRGPELILRTEPCGMASAWPHRGIILTTKPHGSPNLTYTGLYPPHDIISVYTQGESKHG